MAAFWTWIEEHHLSIPLTVVAIILGAILVRWLLIIVITRVVDRIVTGVKKKQNVQDTQSLIASPLTAVRVVQRTRTLGLGARATSSTSRSSSSRSSSW